jgi:hypothetical protein
MHAYVRTCSTVINSTRDRSVPTVFYYPRSESLWPGLVLYYLYKNDNNKTVKGWREKKEQLNRELRVVMVVIVYKEK